MFRPLVTLVLVVLFVLAMLFVEGPGLMRDIELRNAALVPAPDLRVQQAKCTSHWWIVSSCTISYSSPQVSKQQSISFTVFGTMGGERFQLLRTADNRTVTTDIGLAKLTNRVTAALIYLLAMAGIAFVTARKVVQAA